MRSATLLIALLLLLSTPNVSNAQNLRMCTLPSSNSKVVDYGGKCTRNYPGSVSSEHVLTYEAMRELIDGLRSDYKEQAEENRKLREENKAFKEEMRSRYVSDMERMNKLVGDLTESLQQAIYDVAGGPERDNGGDPAPRSGSDLKDGAETGSVDEAGNPATGESASKRAAHPTSEIRAQVAALRLELVHLQSMFEATQLPTE